MVKLKGFTTIEALISSVIILTVLSISMIIFINVITSNASKLEFEAKTKLMEMGINEKDISTQNISFENFHILVEQSSYQGYTDLSLFSLTAYDKDNNVVAQLKMIKKTGK